MMAETDSLASFLDEACADSHLRVEHDFGGGFVRLRSTEAEKRQAAQDIRSSEDVLIELLRNSRDAGAKNIYVATQCHENIRIMLVLDDGKGIPEAMQERIFEPRVTSKLDTAHMDKWGMHGRGMALYSVSVNCDHAKVVLSGADRGTSILVEADISSLGEKKDQSTFPHFEMKDGTLSMRGPKNLLRTLAEFSLEHRDLDLYCGSPAEIAATLYLASVPMLSASEKAFRGSLSDGKLCMTLGYATSPAELELFARSLGLDISERTARRIMDGQIEPVDTILQRIERESLPKRAAAKALKQRKRPKSKLKISDEDMQHLSETLDAVFKDIADKYLIEGMSSTTITIKEDGFHIAIPFDNR